MRSSPGRSRAGRGDDPPRKSTAGRRSPGAPASGDSPAPTPRVGRPASRGGARVSGRRGDALALLESIDGGEFPGSLYVEGSSEPVKAALLAEIRAAWALACPESPKARVVRAAESDVEELLAAFLGVSLFSPRDLIIVLEVEDWGRSEKRVVALAEALERADTPSSLVLVESAAETPRKSLAPLRAACRAVVEAEAPSLGELAGWGRRRFAREHIEAERGVIELLAESCEGDALAFFSELGKLCTWAARDRRLGRAEVQELLRPVVGSELSDYLAAVAAGETRSATQRLGRLLAAGVGEGTILFSLANLVGGALGGWARDRAASDLLRRRAHPVQLSKAMDAVYRAEAAWKGGRADVVAVLEQATRAVSAPS